MKKLLSIILAALMLLSFAFCGTPAAQTTPASSPVRTPVATPEPTPELTPTPFGYENVFSEIFSDTALSELYPDVVDFEKERTRISGNISRIEDFEFYELTDEEQEFIKLAQQGNTDESGAEELSEVLAKIYEKDPHVFDDVDNEVKVDNRINNLIPDLKKVNVDTSDPRYYESTKGVLLACNCGNIENISAETANITAGTNINKNYFYTTIVPDYKNKSWKGNYNVFDFYKLFLDGSEGQKIARKLFEANVKFFSGEKENLDKGLKELVEEYLHTFLINDALQKPGGISGVDSKVHYCVLYQYCLYIFYSVAGELKQSNIYIVPDEYAESIGLLTTELALSDIQLIIRKVFDSEESIDFSAFDELERAQLEKYGNTVHIQRQEQSKGK
ncbi:MAG: hypothetical protein WDA65_07420 [Christensenellales bacterium]